MLNKVFNAIQDDIGQVKNQVDSGQMHSERSELSGSIIVGTYAQMLTAATGAGVGDVAWITNGRKPGESAAAGTGVLAVFDPATGVWLNVSDYTAVVV